MEKKGILFKLLGMNRDLSPSSANPKYAFENKNLRFITRDSNTLLSLVNEKGPKKIENTSIPGVLLGFAEIGDDIITFSYYQDGCIAKYSLVDGEIVLRWQVYNIGLKFDITHPIECIVSIETEDIKKVYWTDGLNQPRVINVASNKRSDIESLQFDFCPVCESPDITVETTVSSSGTLLSGVIQYAACYYNNYGQETPIIYTSPLNYIALNDRGGSPEEAIGCGFKIIINNSDINFDYIRLYSIHYSGEESLTVKRVVDLPTSLNSIVYIDNGTVGDIEDPTKLLYIGGDRFSANTITSKDERMFFGNITLLDEEFTEEEQELIREKCNVEFEYKTITSLLDVIYEGQYYAYSNSLKYSEDLFKGFKGGEYYRFGILFLRETGKWTNPVWIKDILNTLYPRTINGVVQNSRAKITINNILSLKSKYKLTKVRALIAKPTLSSKTILGLGILCPTLYNVKDRVNNSPYAVSSWFMRPLLGYIEYNHNSPLPPSDQRNGEILISDRDHYLSPLVSPESATTISNYEVVFLLSNTSNNNVKDLQLLVVKLESPGSSQSGTIVLVQTFRLTDYATSSTPSGFILATQIASNFGITETDMPSWTALKQQGTIHVYGTVSSESQVGRELFGNYYVDQSIVTFHSPDIEYNQYLIERAQCKIRIIGIVSPTSVLSDYKIKASSKLYNYKCIGEVQHDYSIPSINNEAWGLINGPLWNDSAINSYTVNNRTANTDALFVVYPWHRNGSLNDDSNVDENRENSGDSDNNTVISNIRTSVLQNKIFANCRFAAYTLYFNNSEFWTPRYGISDSVLFRSELVENVRLTINNSKNPYINYYGNVDTIITYPFDYDSANSYNTIGYPIMWIESGQTDGNYHLVMGISELDEATRVVAKGIDPVSIKYKSTPHIVFGFNYTPTGRQVILPRIGNEINRQGSDMDDGKEFPWEINKSFPNTVTPPPTGQHENRYEQHIFFNGTPVSDMPITINSGFYYLAELYRESESNDIKEICDLLYGSISDKTTVNISWIPCSKSNNLNNNTIIENIWGDTYYMRWDCLKTYPFTNEDTNSIVDITSFMVESLLNLDGRYDKNRGQNKFTMMSPINFNLFNKAYNLSSTFFNYRILEEDLNKRVKFPNTIIYSMVKNSTNEIDTWTSPVIASVLDLDGRCGHITSLNTFNSLVIAFLSKGISLIQYNENYLITTTLGVPVEIANSGAVNGYKYLSDSIGCANKWSICTTPSGIYFIDSYNKGIYNLGEGLTSLSDTLGLRTWADKLGDLNEWNILHFISNNQPNTFITYYDKVNQDVLFISRNECLAFSEYMKTFTSFYDYNACPHFLNIGNKGFWYKDNLFWEHNAGEYNNFFDKIKPFHTILIANDDGQTDKIFDSLEFRANVMNGSLEELYNGPIKPFNKVEISNEYLHGYSMLNFERNHPSTLKSKFRIWRALLPREAGTRNRIRNPWAYIKLSNINPLNHKVIIHDITCWYYK